MFLSLNLVYLKVLEHKQFLKNLWLQLFVLDIPCFSSPLVFQHVRIEGGEVVGVVVTLSNKMCV